MIQNLVHCGKFMDISRGAQIPTANSPDRLNLVPWRLMFVSPQSAIGFTSLFSRLEFWKSS